MKDADFISIFHLWKLYLALNNLFSGQVLLPEPPILIQNNDNDIYNQWKVLDIINCCKTKKYRIQYKATYIANWAEWNAAPAWQHQTDFENAKEKISKFHIKRYQCTQMVVQRTTHCVPYVIYSNWMFRTFFFSSVCQYFHKQSHTSVDSLTYRGSRAGKLQVHYSIRRCQYVCMTANDCGRCILSIFLSTIILESALSSKL